MRFGSGGKRAVCLVYVIFLTPCQIWIFGTRDCESQQLPLLKSIYKELRLKLADSLMGLG